MICWYVATGRTPSPTPLDGEGTTGSAESAAASGRSVPPAADALLGALAARAVWRAVEVRGEPGLLWDELVLVQPPFEARVCFTVGDALPAEVATWMPWAGRDLGEDERALLLRPGATYRIEGPVLAGGEELPGPNRKKQAGDKDLPRRGAQFLAAVAAEIALAVEGVLVDVVSQRFHAPEAALRFTEARFDVRDYVSVHAEATEEGLHLHTHGLARFGRADVEMGHVPREALSFGTHVLNEVAQHQALGNIVANGETVLIDGEYPFAVSMTARSGEHVGNPVIALVDPPDAPGRDPRAPRFTLSRFCEEVADDLIREGNLGESLHWLVLAADLAPRESVFRKRAGLYEEMGDLARAAEDRARADSAESV
jgi:hypothetical protein